VTASIVAHRLRLHQASRGQAVKRDRYSHTRLTRVGRGALEDTIMKFINRLRAIVREESGQDLLEYALLVALIALVAAGAVGVAGTTVNQVFQNIVGAIPA
jgi:Flp pilus assembly pilin Flp